MITKTVVIDGNVWTIAGDDQPNPLIPTPAITATVDGANVVSIDCQYRQITSVKHADGCGWGVNLSPACSCARRPVDEGALFAAAREVLTRCVESRAAAEAAASAAAQARRARDGERLVRVPAGCEGCPSALHGGACTCC